MVAFAPVPVDEMDRLEALRSYHVLDTPPDERFDLFTRVSTWLFDVPLAAINLIDAERTFYKSLIGFNPYEPARCTSICAHAVGGDETIMVVNDLAQDSRFQDHPLVAIKGVRFYAGAVLLSPSGHRLGTLCIGDQRPRHFSSDEQQKLVELAAGVGAVMELHRSGLSLLTAATRDALTGLCNRRLFNENLDSAVERAPSGEPCTLLCLDLDRFKQVNDRFGHAGGDALLCEVGRRLTQAVRASDVVARLGGDEFVVMIKGEPTIEYAGRLARRILAALAEPFVYEGKDVPIRSSIGIARCPYDAADPAGLLRSADAALYKAKQAGGDQYQFSDERMTICGALANAPHPGHHPHR